MKKIFVFGSNQAGRHGAGAARAAVLYHGAVYGVWKGLQGESYAIPTKDYNLKTLPLVNIEGYVQEFIDFVKKNPDMRFFLTAVGCGLAGYKPEQIAPMFKELWEEHPNVLFPPEFKEYYDKKTTKTNG